MRCPACGKAARKTAVVLLLEPGSQRRSARVCMTCEARSLKVVARVDGVAPPPPVESFAELFSSVMGAFRVIERNAVLADACEASAVGDADVPRDEERAFWHGRAEGLRSAVATLKANIGKENV